MKDENRPIYVAYPKLDIALTDFLPFNEPVYQKELTFDWDELQDTLDDCKGDFASDRIDDAVTFLEIKGELT